MRTCKLTFLFFLAILYCGYAQLNAYKYIEVPTKLGEFTEDNEYQTSTLLKYLLSENNFEAYYQGDPPVEVAIDKCSSMYIDMLDESSMFRTKLVLVIKDCKDKEIFRTREGSSKSKELKPAYTEAIRDAFGSIEALNYRYDPGKSTGNTVTIPMKNDVKELDTAQEEARDKANQKPGVTVIQEASPERQTFEDKSPKPAAPGLKKAEEPSKTGETVRPVAVSNTDTWYAQPIPDGYQLVDSSPKIRLKMYKTSDPELYLAEAGDEHGIVYEKGGQWFFESYRGGKLNVQVLHIKF